MSSSGPTRGMDPTQTGGIDDPDAVRDTHQGDVVDPAREQPEGKAHSIPGARRRSSTSRSEKEPRLTRQSSAGRTHTNTPPLESQRALSQRSSEDALQRPIEPPVTKSTLSELDVSKIFHNPKLRHDINFDPELHFRPNLDGEKGKKKQDKANQFWQKLREDLNSFVSNPVGFYKQHGDSETWTMPALLKAVKEIIMTLVPQPERQVVEQGFDVSFLMQQFYNGVLELDRLAEWLSNVLKSHCAPMRDEWVDTMYRQLSQGNRESNIDMLVVGLRSLLSVLEAMKLDVANHQIRTLRPALIDETTQFEQKFFHKKISVGRLDISNALEWYEVIERDHGECALSHARDFGEMSLFFEGLTRSILPSQAHQPMPTTFLFDEERIIKLRADAMDMINLNILMRTYAIIKQLPTQLPGAQNSMTDDGHNRSHRYSRDLDHELAPHGSRPSSLASSTGGSATSGSPRSSYHAPAPSYLNQDPVDQEAEAQELYQSLVVLIQAASSSSSSRHAEKWKELVPDLVLQIFQKARFPLQHLHYFEDIITARVCNVNDSQYQVVEESFHSQLMTELGKRVNEFKGLSALGLFNAATRTRANADAHVAALRPNGLNSRERCEENAIQDLATRIAHLGILHWRSWSALAYSSLAEDI